MNRRNSPGRSITCTLLALALLSGSLAHVASAQRRKRKPVVVSFGQPNIWSLEQAHYLLARMHMTNLDLKARELADDALDPNAVNGTRINLLKQLFEAGVSFDQGVGFQNDLLTRNARFNSDRRLELTSDRDRQQSDLLQLTRDHARLVRERALLNSDPSATKDDKDKKDAEITENEAAHDAVKAKLDFDTSELGTLGAQPSGTPQSPTIPATQFDKSRLPDAIIDKLGADKLLEMAKDPKLDASTILDNHIQMQYEIIAKQLTLLRDEVGPGERLVFLELPQSIYTSPGDGDEKMAQTWWHVNGYTRTDPLLRLLLDLYDIERKWHDIQRVSAFRSLRGTDFTACPGEDDTGLATSNTTTPEQNISDTFKRFKTEHDAARNRIIDKLFREANRDFDRIEQNGARDTSDTVETIRRMLEVKSVTLQGDDRKGAQGSTLKYVDRRMEDASAQPNDQTSQLGGRDSADQMTWELLNILSAPHPNVCDKSKYSFDKGIQFMRLDDEIKSSSTAASTNVARRTVRTVDIIPRQSSMNVNDLNDTVKAFGLWGSFKFLFGLGGQTSFQRQREQFEQFLHQELYASGFGKGDRDFGWTFGALPGTKRVAPGVRTTYAVLVVPEAAESIVLSARGCYFPRHDDQPLDFADTADSHWDHTSRNCGDAQTYIIPIPGGGDTSNFWVTNIDYTSADKGTRATVSVRGNNFSSQIGVLVDGVPLTPAVGLAQPLLHVRHNGADDEKCAPLTSVCGEFERIDPQQIVFSFSMPKGSDGKDYEGTPTITLVAPGKSVDLNPLPNMTINGKRNLTLGDGDVPYILGEREKPSLSISDLKVFRASPYSRAVVALLSGAEFVDGKDTIFVNGVEMGTHGTTKTFVSPQLYRLEFKLPSDDNLDVSLIQTSTTGKQKFKTKSFPNTSALRISKVTALSYEPPANKKSHGVLIAKLEGEGFNSRLLLRVDGASKQLSRIMDVSPNEAIVRLVDPEASVVVSLLNLASDEATKTVVTRGAAADSKPPSNQK